MFFLLSNSVNFGKSTVAQCVAYQRPGNQSNQR